MYEIENIQYFVGNFPSTRYQDSSIQVHTVLRIGRFLEAQKKKNLYGYSELFETNLKIFWSIEIQQIFPVIQRLLQFLALGPFLRKGTYCINL